MDVSLIVTDVCFYKKSLKSSVNPCSQVRSIIEWSGVCDRIVLSAEGQFQWLELGSTKRNMQISRLITMTLTALEVRSEYRTDYVSTRTIHVLCQEFWCGVQKEITNVPK